MYLSRTLENDIWFSLENFPVTAVIGPRQCGKSTMVKQTVLNKLNSIYLDLERPSDLQKLEEAEWFFISQKNSLVCIDEIQRKPELFTLIRSLVDEWGENGRFLVLGSASAELLRQSSESLAGRISYNRLTPFLWNELNLLYPLETSIERGGFPGSMLASSTRASLLWRENFITTFLERDIQQWTSLNPVNIRRIWQMLAHHNGQTANYSALGNSLGLSNVSIRNYIDILLNLFILEVVPPYFSNAGKRLVKAPKIYIADSGLCMSLLGVQNFEQLTGHPALGSIWEQIVLSNLKGNFPGAKFYFYRTTNGAEADFVMEQFDRKFVIECKASYAPVLSKGFYFALEDIKPHHTFVVIPSEKGFSMNKSMDVVSLSGLIKGLKEQFSTE